MSIEDVLSDEVSDEEATLDVSPRKRKLEDAEMDITPMIDITFLLLIFFLVASHLDPSASLKLPPAKYGSAVSDKSSVVVTVSNDENGGSARIYKGNGKDAANLVKTSDLVGQEDELVAYIEQELLGSPPKLQVLIKAERGVKHRDVARVQSAVGRVESAQQLYVAVEEVD